MVKKGSFGRQVGGEARARTGLRRVMFNILTACGLLATIATPVIIAEACEGVGQEPSAEEQGPKSGLFATYPFELEQGLAIVNMTHQGEGSFVVNLLSAEQGETAEASGRLEFFGDAEGGGRSEAALSLADKAGSVDISRAVPVPTSEKHLFDVKADGPWTIQVEQPHPSSAPEPTRFSGNEDSATPFFQLFSGPKTINVTNPAGGNSMVFLRDADGNEVHRIPGDETDQTQQEDQPSTVSSEVDIREDGIYIFDIRADGLWKIEISDAG